MSQEAALILSFFGLTSLWGTPWRLFSGWWRRRCFLAMPWTCACLVPVLSCTVTVSQWSDIPWSFSSESGAFSSDFSFSSFSFFSSSFFWCFFFSSFPSFVSSFRFFFSFLAVSFSRSFSVCLAACRYFWNSKRSGGAFRCAPRSLGVIWLQAIFPLKPRIQAMWGYVLCFGALSQSS